MSISGLFSFKMNMSHEHISSYQDTCSKLLLPALFLFISILIAFKWASPSKTSRHHNLPPSPFALPVIGNLHQLGSLHHRGLASLAQRYGSLMLLHFGSARTLVVSSASAAQEIMKTHDAIFSNRPNLGVFQKLMYNRNDIASAPYGESWRQTKSIVVQQLLSSKKVLTYRTVREEEVSKLIRKIGQTCGNPFDLSEYLASLPINITCRVAFGKKYDVEEGELKFDYLLEEFSSLMGSYDVGDFIPWLGWLNNFTGRNSRIKRVSGQFDRFIERVINDHLTDRDRRTSSQDHTDIVDALLDSSENDYGGASLSREQMKGAILDVFTGGTDTMAATLEWAMAELLRHPEVMKKVQKEIRSVLGHPNEHHVTEDEVALAELNYLRAVIKETHRMHPAGPLLLPRESTQAVNIQGYDIPSQTRVVVNAWAIGRDPCSWDNPHEFNPERFLKGDSISAREFNGQCFDLIPFGAGRRRCPGISYANAIVEFALARLLCEFDWSLPAGARAEDIDMSERLGLAVAKKFPLVLVASLPAAV
uniref:Cytochrome P450 n=1 Tax=Kalanchoe fedtschenkoi TaxID=63787 RepID=A0A7N0V0V8_KALFE